MNRSLKYINLVVALALLVAGGIAWWYAWRVLAKTSGTVNAPLEARAVAQQREDLRAAREQALAARGCPEARKQPQRRLAGERLDHREHVPRVAHRR